MSVRIAGHAIHPMLIVLPLGLMVSSVVFDILMLATYNSVFAAVAYWNIGFAVLTGLMAAFFGLLDWTGIPAGTRAKRVGVWHAVINVLVVGLFALSWVFRRSDPLYVASDPALALSWGAVLLSLVSGWLGGELVERHRMTIYDEPDWDAPSSLHAGEHGPAIHREHPAGGAPGTR
jgi:uncharacterized membrane protein